ncbi:hypothetical protein MD484_g8962, partial [Candolleomyces efflorescens]
MSSRRGLTFWGTVAAVWTGLKLKKEWDDYSAVSTDDPEARIRLPNTPLPREDAGADTDDVSLLDSNTRVRRQKKKSTGCCVCCGIDCTLFWKAFAIVLALWTAFGIFKLAKWALTPSLEGTENMPTFGANLGCDHAATYYKDAPDGYTLTVPAPANVHKIQLAGSGVGTLTLTAAPANATDVSYKVTMKGTDKVLLDMVDLRVDESKFGSRLEVNTPSISSGDLASGAMCIRYDVVLEVPQNLKELYVRGSTTLQVKFDEKSHLDFERLSIILFTKDEKNMILPQAGFHASDELYLEVYNGWVVGDVSIGDNTVISTQRSDAVANVRIHPFEGDNHSTKSEKAAKLYTATGLGRSDFFYMSNKAFKRPIDSRHISGKNGDVYLRYQDSKFDGKIALTSKSSTMWGAVTKIEEGSASKPGEPKWNYIRGNADGKDKMVIESGGWTGLYF